MLWQQGYCIFAICAKGAEKVQETERLEGTVENIVYASEESGYIVFEVAVNDEIITATGEVGNLCEGEDVVLHGVFVNHANFGRQFKVMLCEVSLPKSVSAIRTYLSSGALPHIGPALSKRIVDCFGAQTLEIIANEPERLAGIKGLSATNAKNISYEFKRIFGIREAVSWLAKFGISSSQSIEIYRIYGAETINAISNDPYLLCFDNLNISFQMADAMAAELQLDGEGNRRVSAAILYILKHNLLNGHTCLPKEKLLQTAADFIGVTSERILSVVNIMLEDTELELATCKGKDFVFLPELYNAERGIAAHLGFLSKFPVIDTKLSEKRIQMNESITGIQYAPLQREAIRQALERRVLVLTGGPGTGKTTTINAMISCFEAEGERVSLAAPTGRAAKRLSELTGRKAQTIHRLLEVDYSKDNIVRFIHNQKNKLRCDAIVIDEMSMVDAPLFENLIAALKSSCRIIMVGDEDQLPSVGAGSILSGLIASNVVPVVRLKDVFRQAAQSLIVENAHHIVAGEPLQKGSKDSDFFMLEAKGEQCAELIEDLVSKRLPSAYGYGASDIQVLCPTKIGVLGTVALNIRLQKLLNPPAPNKPQLVVGGKTFRVGDKVMQIKNNYDITFTRENGEDGVGAFNGDMGVIESVDTNTASLTVKSEDRYIMYSQEALSQLEMAYAVTIHKSQGSEFEAVIMPIADVPQKLRYRNLLYTGVTRAKNLCIITGLSFVVSEMAKNVRHTRRFTCIDAFLQAEVGIEG